jgi:hypothetical protein
MHAWNLFGMFSDKLLELGVTILLRPLPCDDHLSSDLLSMLLSQIHELSLAQELFLLLVFYPC